jgi:radical SAM superfamily enzyme YgiQ (UPF0313 family)
LAALAGEPAVDVQSVAIPVNTNTRSAEDVARELLRETVGLPATEVDIAFGAYVWGEELLRSVLRLLRAGGFAGRIVLGGPQISYGSQNLEALYPEADAFVRGYGEDALRRLAASSSKQDIPGVHWAQTKDIQHQATVNLETLKSPWLTGTIPLEGQSFIRWETQRGCTYRCTFCQHREPGERLVRKGLSLPRVEAEIDLFCQSGVREIAVLDPIYNLAPHAVQVLQRFADHGYTGRLSLQCRAEAVTEAFLDAAQALDVCLEFGIQTIHENEGRAVRRKNKPEKIDWALEQVRNRRIHHEVSLIFGLPLQTLASFEQSIQWCLERQVPVIKAFPLLALRGTQLERDLDHWDLVHTGGSMPMVVQSSTFNQDDWRAMACLSEALKETEEHHPSRLEDLRTIAARCEPDLLRWAPAPIRRAA